MIKEDATFEDELEFNDDSDDSLRQSDTTGNTPHMNCLRMLPSFI